MYRLRRLLAVIAVLFSAVIAGMYFYARMRQRDVLKEIPNKLGFNIKQTAAGFQFSKSDGKRTQFTVQASDLKQFKLNGSAELHNVTIVLYGRDSSRFDQIYGDNFTYDKQSGNITARGDVQIDLEANPSGLTGPDQGTPKELKNPIHLKTKELAFNQNSGDASTDARVDFQTPQAVGWAIGMQYAGKSNTLTLGSQIHVTLGGQNLFATHGRITRDPHVVVLDHPRLVRASGTVQAEQATFFLGPENEVQRLLATGNVHAEAAGLNGDQMHARADEADLLLTGKKNLLRTATLTGHVHVERVGSQAMQGDAGRALLYFAELVKGQNQLQKIHAEEGVRLSQHAATNEGATTTAANAPQNFDITAPIIDFFVAEGRRLDHADTSGAAQIAISPAQNPLSAPASAQRTVVTAGRFNAKFAATPDGATRLTSIHGAPDAKIVNSAPGLPDRVSTSRALDTTFLPEGGIASIVQQGSVAYSDGQTPDKRTQAWADRAVYTPADEVLVLNGSPRVSEGSMVTTATTIRVNRASDDAFANGNVKSTYSELKEQPNGALLASSSPIHVTAASMTAHNSPAIALYQGSARLWQDANIVEAPSIRFDRDHRSLVAQGTAAKRVSTVLVEQSQPEKADPQKEPGKVPHKGDDKTKAKARPSETVAISADRLTYADAERRAHYEGGVVAKGNAFTESSDTMDAYLVPRAETEENKSLAGQGQLDHMVAQGNVVILQPSRRAEGHTLVYTAADDKFVLTGGPPSIFDAERGKITGVSLTFFRGDDRVLVEGEASTPVVTQTRVAR